jgi:hypothetical protein
VTRLPKIAIFLIAACALSTGVRSQDVYRCGNNYSQKPCPNAVVVDVQDARTQAQRAESDAAVQREVATGNAMEKARLQEEAQQRARLAASPSKTTPSKPKKTASASDTDGAGTAHAKAKKGHAKRKKEPEYFTARGAAEKPKTPASARK